MADCLLFQILAEEIYASAMGVPCQMPEETVPRYELPDIVKAVVEA